MASVALPASLATATPFFFSSRRRHTRFDCDWSSDVCSSDLSLKWLSSQLAGPHAVAGRARGTQPFEREDEKSGGDEVGNFDDLFGADHGVHGFLGPLARNILSIRSVIRNPPTRLPVAATMAMVPSTVESVLLCSPTRRIAPTTAMASSALVSDINGVCRSGETRRITSKPMNPASMKT